MDISVTPGDITKVQVDAIVNAANSTLLGGGGVDGAIHRAGGEAILQACQDLRATALPAGLPTGQAVATTAGHLPARWVIHTVGPIWSPPSDQSDLLASCYRESLAVADQIGADSVAFPVISAGIYGWPMEDAVAIAVQTVRSTPSQVSLVRFVPFNDEASEAFAKVLKPR